MGNIVAAKQDVAAALTLAPGRDVKLLAALTLAQAGETARAKAIVEELEKNYPSQTILKVYSNKRAHVRRLFHRLDGWIRRRLWSHRYKHSRNAGWTQLPLAKPYGEYELVRLLDLIPSLAIRRG